MPGTFVLSLDTELVWGSFDHLSDDRFAATYPDVRGTIDAMLDLLDRYEIAATWAVVGHVFLERCTRDDDGRAHGDLPRPSFTWYPHDWYDRDPCTDRARAPLWYGRDIVENITGRDVAHEVGSHGFSHAPFGDPGMTVEVARADIDACLAASATLGLTPTSFVFPRNREGHHEILAEHGFTAFRGADPTWHRGLRGPLARGAHLFDQAAAIPPPVSRPIETLPGLWNVPGSMLLLHRTGIRRAVPMLSRVTKARLGLRRAVSEEAVFHLWTHPFNLAHDRPAMLGGFEAILAAAADLRAKGRLSIRTMAEVAADAAAATAPTATAAPD